MAGGLVALSGAGLIVIGFVMARGDVMVLGLAGLLVVMAGLLVGLRFRLATLQSSLEHLSVAVRGQLLTQLEDFKRISAEDNRLVLRSFRDMDVARREHAAGLLETRQALDSLRSELSGRIAGRVEELIASPKALLAIAGEVRARGPGLVVECGSGFSTICIAQALRGMGVGALVSLESSVSRAQAGHELLAAHDLQDFARISPASVDACPRDISMLVVNGAAGPLSALVRYPLPILLDGLMPGAVVVVDGVVRDDASEILAWLRQQGAKILHPRMISETTMAFDHVPGQGKTE